MVVRRTDVFQDSYEALKTHTWGQFKYARIKIKFDTEDGVDSGGLTREWFTLISQQMLRPELNLFVAVGDRCTTFEPNPDSGAANPRHLEHFRFIGRLVGKGIYQKWLLACHFTRAFYKHILGLPVDFDDLRAVDPEYCNSLDMLRTGNCNAEDLGFTFSCVVGRRTVELKPNGNDIVVTESNKNEYIRLVTEYKLRNAIKPQVDAFVAGFREIIPAYLLESCDVSNFELLLCGLPKIDVDDMQKNTIYEGFTEDSPQVIWFWQAVRQFNVELRTKLLQFATGSAQVPPGGFANLIGSGGPEKFKVAESYCSTEHLPVSHTCYNKIDLPLYASYDELYCRLHTAITECSTGFGQI